MKTLGVTIFACNKNDYTTNDLTHPLKYKSNLLSHIVYQYYELIQATSTEVPIQREHYSKSYDDKEVKNIMRYPRWRRDHWKKDEGEEPSNNPVGKHLQRNYQIRY